jgi:hypothetical protein
MILHMSPLTFEKICLQSMISQKDLKFCNSPPENLTVYEFLTFTYGPLNFCKKIATRNFQKKDLKLP